MRRDKIIAQLESELVAAKAALADKPVCCFETVEEVNGYWTGRLFGLRQTLTLLKGKELDDEA
jgi:hypothetical protein